MERDRKLHDSTSSLDFFSSASCAYVRIPIVSARFLASFTSSNRVFGICPLKQLLRVRQTIPGFQAVFHSCRSFRFKNIFYAVLPASFRLFIYCRKCQNGKTGIFNLFPNRKQAFNRLFSLIHHIFIMGYFSRIVIYSDTFHFIKIPISQGAIYVYPFPLVKIVRATVNLSRCIYAKTYPLLFFRPVDTFYQAI